MTFRTARQIATLHIATAVFFAALVVHEIVNGQTVRPPTTQSSTHRGIDLNRIVVWTEAAGGYPTPRGFHPTLLKQGWKAFVAEQIQPEIDWLKLHGVKRPRVLLHNPYGLEIDAAGNVSEYRFSQRRLCQANPATRELANGLDDAIRPLVKSGVEVIVYFGAIDHDPVEILPSMTGRADDFIRESLYQIQEALDAGASIAFDASSNYQQDSPAFRFVALVDSVAKTYIEPRPHASRPHLFAYPIITQDAFWHRSNPEKYPDSRWGAPNDQLTGEIIRFVQFPDKDPAAPAGVSPWLGTAVADRLIAPAVRIQRDGHTAALTTKHIRLADK